MKHFIRCIIETDCLNRLSREVYYPANYSKKDIEKSSLYWDFIESLDVDLDKEVLGTIEIRLHITDFYCGEGEEIEIGTEEEAANISSHYGLEEGKTIPIDPNEKVITLTADLDYYLD